MLYKTIILKNYRRYFFNGFLIAMGSHANVAYLNINPIGENPNHSNLAAVGMWTNISVRIFSLPDLSVITKEQLGG